MAFPSKHRPLSIRETAPVSIFGILAVVGAAYALRVYASQGWLGPALVTIALTPLVFLYFLHILGVETRVPTEVLLALAMATSGALVMAIVFASRSPAQVVELPIRGKLSTRQGSWQILFPDDFDMYVPYDVGKLLERGQAVKVRYRDAWLGVRFIEQVDVEPMSRPVP